DFHVTGVQTCALPIWRAQGATKCIQFSFEQGACTGYRGVLRHAMRGSFCPMSRAEGVVHVYIAQSSHLSGKRVIVRLLTWVAARSEERRGGKERRGCA